MADRALLLAPDFPVATLRALTMHRRPERMDSSSGTQGGEHAEGVLGRPLSEGDGVGRRNPDLPWRRGSRAPRTFMPRANPKGSRDGKVRAPTMRDRLT